MTSKFGYCPSQTVRIVWAFCKYNSSPLGPMGTFISFLKKWANPGLFLFIFFLFLLQFQYKLKKGIDDVLGIWTRGHRMVGADFFTNAPFQSVTLCSRQCAAYLTFQCLYLSISLFSTFDLWIKMSQTESSFWSKFDTKRRRKEDPSIWFSDTHKKTSSSS